MYQRYTKAKTTLLGMILEIVPQVYLPDQIERLRESWEKMGQDSERFGEGKFRQK